MQQKYLALTMVFQRTVTTPLRLCLTLARGASQADLSLDRHILQEIVAKKL
jgi:hypothetical protein